MQRFLHTNFTGGEVSPLLGGRVDWSRYYNTARKEYNMVSLPYGPATRRPGTIFVERAKYHNRKARIVRFEFNVQQAYALEFGHYYLRVFKDHGVITSSGSPYEVVTPYAEADLPGLRFTRSADVMIITHGNYPTRILTRIDHDNWTLAEAEFIDGPYLDPLDYNLTPSGTSGNVTLTAAEDTFNENHVGSMLRWRADDGFWYWFVITEYTDAKHVKAEVMGIAGMSSGDLPNINASKPFRMGAWCDSEGYPLSVGFFQQRLCFGGSALSPQTMWLSAAGDFYNFAPSQTRTQRDYLGGEFLLDTTTAEDASTYTINAANVNPIRWIEGAKLLTIGTLGGEWQAGGGSSNDPLTPDSVNFQRDTGYGSADIQGRLVEDSVLFVTRYGRGLRELTYSFNKDRFVAPNLLLPGEHLLYDDEGNVRTIVDLAHVNDPVTFVWCVLSDGTMLGLTYARDEDVVGWHQHETDGKFESIDSIPGQDRDELWMVVCRIDEDGNEVRNIEYMAAMPRKNQKNMFLVDCGLTYNGVPASEISGLDHLEGKRVAIIADGIPHPSLVVGQGKVTLNFKASVVHIGLPYSSVLIPMRPEFVVQGGTIQGKVKNIVELTVEFFETVGAYYGPSEDDLRPFGFREAGSIVGEALPLYSGYKTVDFPGDFNEDGQVVIAIDGPLPMTIVSISYEVNV